MSHLRTAVALLALTACADEKTSDYGTPIQTGESRTIELRFTPLDVTNFEKALTRIDLDTLSPDLLHRTWLTDLALVAEPGGDPRMIDFALEDIKNRDTSSPDITIAEANLVKLLQMTPTNADLTGTAMAPLLDLAPHIGFTVPEVLGSTLGVAPGDTFLTPAQLGGAMVNFVIGSHPNAQMRTGPRTADNPEGLYPVTPGRLPVYLEDIVSDLATLQGRFGPYIGEDGYHPGFIAGPVEANLFGDDLQIVVRANVNGVPDKGIDLQTVSLAGVNSIDDHPDTLFNTDDPDWLRIEGTFNDPPTIDRMVFAMGEDPRHIPSGDARNPAPYGNSPVWRAAPYTLERVVAEAAFAGWSTLNQNPKWIRRPGAEPLLEVSVENGWMTLTTPGNVGDPPAPAYIWDILLEVAQARLHDGGLSEGDVQLELVLEDVPLGLSMTALTERVKEALADDPDSLIEVAKSLFDNTWGEADIFYRHLVDSDADYLFFIDPTDIPRNRAGEPIREYSYKNPGFFRDAELTDQIGTRDAVDDDTVHLKVKVKPGQTYYCEDENGAVYRLKIGEKPSRARLPITVEKVR